MPKKSSGSAKNHLPQMAITMAHTSWRCSSEPPGDPEGSPANGHQMRVGGGTGGVKSRRAEPAQKSKKSRGMVESLLFGMFAPPLLGVNLREWRENLLSEKEGHLTLRGDTRHGVASIAPDSQVGGGVPWLRLRLALWPSMRSQENPGAGGGIKCVLLIGPRLPRHETGCGSETSSAPEDRIDASVQITLLVGSPKWLGAGGDLLEHFWISSERRRVSKKIPGLSPVCFVWRGW